jgi:hypothetical protein
MSDDKVVRYFDFTNELIVELTDSEVREAYDKWRTAADGQNALPLFSPEQVDLTPLYDTFLAVAYAHYAVYPLT